MPSQILHSLFGEDLYSEIAGELNKRGCSNSGLLKELISQFNNDFILGTQGPDLFYHSLSRRPVALSYGSLLHRRGIGSFSASLLSLCINKNNEIINKALFVYALGFISHPFLDRAAHPYIVYKSHLAFPRSHAFFERIIDVLMLENLRKIKVSDWDQVTILAESCEKCPEHLIKGLASALEMTNQKKDKLLLKRMENAFLDSASFYRYTSPSSTSIKNPEFRERALILKKRSLSIFFPEDLPSGMDFLNLEKEPWYDPSGLPSGKPVGEPVCKHAGSPVGKTEGLEANPDYRSFPEIYRDCIKKASASLTGIIQKFLEGHPYCPAEMSLAIGNGGLSITGRNGKPSPVRVSKPLPLGEILDQQAALRGIIDV